jgi:acetate kinase
VNEVPPTHTVLCLNGGSSSLKVALYEVSERTEAVSVRGAVERIGTNEAWCWIRGADERVLTETKGMFADHAAAVHATFDALDDLQLPIPVAAGHRIVHGGPSHAAPQRIDAPLLATLRELIPYAPLHLPCELRIIDAVESRFPDLPQVACFDTAFHRRMPEIAQRFPLPRRFWEDGLRRYGFHGLSYEFILSELKEEASGRTIVAHLGNGASMAAVRDGMPIDTTMGFTPAGGFMMGTRSGDLDPGVLVYLMRERGLSGDAIDRIVNQESGLLGVSGISGDMKVLLERSNAAPAAALAVELFCYQLRKTVGALAAALGGLDNLVFTGGIGERAAAVRWQACQGLEHLGVRLDPAKNDAHAETISTPEASCTVRVIPTDEDRIIARHTRSVVFG